MRQIIWDSDAYGVNTDSPETVSDWFNPSSEDMTRAKAVFDEALMETLTEIAGICHIPYEVYNEWDKYDWDEFREVLCI